MVLPNLFLNVQPDYVNSHLMFPTGPQSVRIVYDWLFEPRHLPLSDDDLAHYVALWDVTNRQDARNCEWQQQGMQLARLPSTATTCRRNSTATASRSGCGGDSARSLASRP